MSRLRALTIPLVQGQNDGIAKEVLPDGALARLVNGRFNKAGEVALREGWRTVGTEDSAGTAVVVRDLYSYGESLVALRAFSGGGVGLAAASTESLTRPWYPGQNRLSPATDVRPVGGMPLLRVAPTAVSQAITPDGAYGCMVQQNTAQAETHFRIFRYDTDETLAYRQTALPALPLKVVASLNDEFAMVDNSGTALRYRRVAVADGLPTSGGTALVTATVTDYDVATAAQTAPTALHVAWIAAGNVSYSQFNLTTGAQVGSTKTVYAGGDAVYVALATDDVSVHVVYQKSVAAFAGDLALLTFSATSPFTTTTGPTALFGGADVVEDKFAVAAVPADGAGCAAVVARPGADLATGDHTIWFVRLAAAHTGTTAIRAEAYLAGGLVVVGNQVAYGYGRDSAVVYADPDKVWWVLHGEGDSTGSDLNALWAPGQAPGGLVLVAGRSADGHPVPRAFTVDPTTRRQAVSFNGDLYITGGSMGRWVGLEVSETGLLAPAFIDATPSNGSGSLTALGVYKYRAMVRWQDSRGAVFEGEVSTEQEVTLGALDDTVTIRFAAPPSLARSADILGPPVYELYRTEAGPGELFYLADTTTLVTADVVTFVDTRSDAVILDEPRLYTEGEFGATSGRLDNVLPRPSTYLAATRDRLVGAAPAPEYQVSQVTLSSEPVSHADPGVSGPIALVYFDQASEAITGVATLDDSIVVGTARQLYTTGGEGPNFAGVGEFPSPARLPANVGFYDWRSILETAEGLWFLGDRDKLHLLARGEAAPVWAGEAVEDSFTTGTTVGAALQVTDHVAAWAVAGASAAASVLVVRDLPIQAWSTDSLPFIPVTLVSHEGEFWSADTAGTAWRQATGVYGDGPSTPTAPALVVETGDVQVFGLAGQGRLAVVEWAGVFQAAASLLVEISYDQGVSWTSLGTATVTGLTAGAPFREQWYPARQRGGKFRTRCTMTPTSATTEGCRLTGVTIFHTVRGGQSRLPAANRR